MSPNHPEAEVCFNLSQWTEWTLPFALKWHLEQAVLVGIPVVVLEGSGRLYDYLPKLWVRRFATGFDAVKESNRFCEEIGFKETNDGTLGRQLCQVERENFRNYSRNDRTHAINRKTAEYRLHQLIERGTSTSFKSKYGRHYTPVIRIRQLSVK